MAHVDREADSLPSFAAFVPTADNVTDEVVAVSGFESIPPPARPVAPAAGAQLQLQGFPYRTPDSARLQLSRAHVDASVVVPHMADRAHVLRFEPDSLRLTT